MLKEIIQSFLPWILYFILLGQTQQQLEIAVLVAAITSILVRKPFTIQYAKERVSQDKWQHPLFLKINYLLSGVWGCMFLISLALNILRMRYPLINPWLYEILSYIPNIFAIWFTMWFPDWYKEKYLIKQTDSEKSI